MDNDFFDFVRSLWKGDFQIPVKPVSLGHVAQTLPFFKDCPVETATLCSLIGREDGPCKLADILPEGPNLLKTVEEKYPEVGTGAAIVMESLIQMADRLDQSAVRYRVNWHFHESSSSGTIFLWGSVFVPDHFEYTVTWNLDEPFSENNPTESLEKAAKPVPFDKLPEMIEKARAK